MGRHRKIIEVELEKDQYLPEKSAIKLLSGKHIAHFVGDTYNHSIQMAWEWVESLEKKIVLRDYYPQKMGGKAILVSYDIKE
jgi:hypothetical protein